MNIRWRIGILGLQLLVLLSATAVVVGRPLTTDVWFFAGLLAVAINPQLLEPYYPRPGDVVGNSIVFLLLYAVAPRSVAAIGWQIAAIVVALMGMLALVGVLASQRPKRGAHGFDLSRAARGISQTASAQRIYSTAFFLSLIDFRAPGDQDFWVLSGAWAGLIVLGNINWQRIWTSSSSVSGACTVEGVVGPSVLTVTAPNLPKQDSWVVLESHSGTVNGIMIRRISRRDDVWGQIHVVDAQYCETFLADGEIALRVADEQETILVGSVDAGSSDTSLAFVATRPLQIGRVVAVPLGGTNTQVLYQLVGVVVESTDVKGGAHLFERARAQQLGIFHSVEHRFRRHLWTPSPGAPVLATIDAVNDVQANPPAGWEPVGHVIGTSLPVFLDLSEASTGHVAILGMTKMGKSTLAERLARRLAEIRCVTILDLTGEYVRKKGFPPCGNQTDWTAPGVSVFEPKPGETPAARAETFLKFLLEKAEPEYQAGQPFPRTIIIDEAHQFIPEPAGLGFNAPGRDNSFRIGLLMMQVRKFGISVILISQRTAVVAKSALSQCENLIAFRNVDQTGLDYLEALAGGDVRYMLPRLKQGEALVFGPAVSSDLPIAVNVFLVPPPADQGVDTH
jgi:hypothetical protein